MKILTDDHWKLLEEQINWLKTRVRELEQQQSALLDRLLIQQGQLPMDLGTVKIVQEENRQEKELTESLFEEEIGEDPKDDVESS